MTGADLSKLHAEHLKALQAARRAYDLAMATYRAAPAGPLREAAQQAHYAAGDVVNLAQNCVYTSGHALRQSSEQET